jgi:TrmH family RNA methyltransferase
MPNYRVIFAGPKFQGNVGAIARAMKNFQLNDLYLVNSCEIGDECLARAKHGKDLVENAKHTESLEEAIEGLDFIVGTSGISSKSHKKHLRRNLTPKDLALKMSEIDGSVGILFGRENYGLYNSELEMCDNVVTIPASSDYPILNISHAASIIFYEIFQVHVKERDVKVASGFERDKMMRHFTNLLDVISYPPHKKKKTTVMFQRILGRAVLSKWEFHELMGVFSRSLNTIERNEKNG